MIPDTVKVNMQDGIFMAEGPMGKLESPLNEDIEVNIEENIIKMKPKSEINLFCHSGVYREIL